MVEWIKRHRILLIVQVVLLFALVPSCFKTEELVYSKGASLYVSEISDEGNITFISDLMNLTKGVYRLKANTQIPEDACILLNVKNIESDYQSIDCNPVTGYPGQTYVEFEAYVKYDTENVYISCWTDGVGEEAILSLELYKTSLGNRMLLFSLFSLFILLDILIGYRERIHRESVSRESQIVFWTLTVCVFISYFPFLMDYINLGADSDFHLLRIEGLKESLQEMKTFPVRVQSYWLYDHGYAVSSFYGDLFLTIPAVFRLIGFSIQTSYKMFVFLVTVATAWITYISFKRCTKDTYGALFGSVIYMLAPYRIYNVFGRGAVGEYLGMVFLPMLMCGMYLLYTEDTEAKDYKHHKYWIVFGLTGILQSHLLSCEMAGGFILLICVIFIRKTLRKNTFVQLFQALIICLLLNSWFWIPLLYMMQADQYWLHGLVENAIQVKGTWLEAMFQLWPNVGGRQTGLHNVKPIQMGVSVLLLWSGLLVFWLKKLCAWIRTKKKISSENPYNGTILLLLGLLGLSWYMSTKYFPWDFLARIPILDTLIPSLQFPTRLMSPVSAFGAMLAAFFVPWFRIECGNSILLQSGKKKLERMLYSILVILAVGSATYQVNDILYHMNPIYFHTIENLGTLGVVNGEYLLEGMQKDSLCYHGPIAQEGLNWSEYEKQGTNIAIYLENTCQESRVLELPLLGYKGYCLESDSVSEESPYISEERGEHGDLRVIVPGEYKGNISIRYAESMLYLIADYVSLVTILIMSGYGIYHIRKKNRKNE